jgi:hypothetical protein
MVQKIQQLYLLFSFQAFKYAASPFNELREAPVASLMAASSVLVANPQCATTYTGNQERQIVVAIPLRPSLPTEGRTEPPQ